MKKYLLFLLPVSLFVSADLPVQKVYMLSSGYMVTIDGTSNLRNWQEKVGQVAGEITAVVNVDGSVDLRSLRITMVVLSIKSDMGRVMDNKTYEGLKAATYPEILFTMNKPLKLMQVRDGQNAVPVKGNLMLAGICKPVIMEVTTFEIKEGKLVFEGSQALKMTDYGVKPPSALFGTMRAGPDITIRFKTNFSNPSITTTLKN
jgi:polyisoprenoid-binding protein YceI